nr:UDP-3-O-acyl-N-acetylglucosamine deacetylase [Prochlorococcus sp. MIT 1223]
MDIWPCDYEGAWTLANPFRRKGIALHSGEVSEAHIFPSEVAGFHISWIDQEEKPVALNTAQIRNTPLCTTLDFENKSLSTVEHLLSALVGCGLTHVHIKVSGNEIPILDGSAKCWVDAIQEVGLKPAITPSEKASILKKSILLNRGDSVISAIPAKKLKLIGVIDFPYQAIGQQMYAIELCPNNFVKEIAPARTFGFIDQIDQLKKAGLIKGGGLENALVCDGSTWLNPPLRFKDEPVRHKLLDLIGDLALVGLPKAQVLVYKGSHSLHADLAAALLEHCSTD